MSNCSVDNSIISYLEDSKKWSNFDCICLNKSTGRFLIQSSLDKWNLLNTIQMAVYLRTHVLLPVEDLISGILVKYEINLRENLHYKINIEPKDIKDNILFSKFYKDEPKANLNINKFKAIHFLKNNLPDLIDIQLLADYFLCQIYLYEIDNVNLLCLNKPLVYEPKTCVKPSSCPSVFIWFLKSRSIYSILSINQLNVQQISLFQKEYTEKRDVSIYLKRNSFFSEMYECFENNIHLLGQKLILNQLEECKPKIIQNAFKSYRHFIPFPVCGFNAEFLFQSLNFACKSEKQDCYRNNPNLKYFENFKQIFTDNYVKQQQLNHSRNLHELLSDCAEVNQETFEFFDDLLKLCSVDGLFSLVDITWINKKRRGYSILIPPKEILVDGCVERIHVYVFWEKKWNRYCFFISLKHKYPIDMLDYKPQHENQSSHKEEHVRAKNIKPDDSKKISQTKVLNAKVESTKISHKDGSKVREPNISNNKPSCSSTSSSSTDLNVELNKVELNLNVYLNICINK